MNEYIHIYCISVLLTTIAVTFAEDYKFKKWSHLTIIWTGKGWATFPALLTSRKLYLYMHISVSYSK